MAILDDNKENKLFSAYKENELSKYLKDAYQLTKDFKLRETMRGSTQSMGSFRLFQPAVKPQLSQEPQTPNPTAPRSKF